MSSEDLILDIMHEAHLLGIHDTVINKVSEISGSITIFDSYQRAQIFEQAYKLVIDERTKNKNII
jgi:hypothetical protein